MITEERIRAALRGFTVRKYEITLTPVGNPNLPEYLGSTLRGALAMAMRRTVCSDLRAACGGCKYHKSCAYASLFEPQVEEALPNLKGVKEVPRPFVLRPPLVGTPLLPELVFEIVLFGNSWHFLPHIVFALQTMSEEGLGAGRDKFEFRRVTCGDELIFDAKVGKLRSMGNPLGEDTLFGSSQGPAKGLTCEFLTPLRVKYQSHLGPELTFEVFLRALMRRISTLARLYCGFEPDVPYKEMVSCSKEIVMTRNELKWKEWQRYSNRQKTRMQMGGMTGLVTYEGDLTAFRPLVNLGRYTHAGKGTIFGLGRYNAWWE